MEAPNSFGNSFLGIIIAILLIYIFTLGDPDVIDGIRIIILNFAELNN